MILCIKVGPSWVILEEFLVIFKIKKRHWNWWESLVGFTGVGYWWGSYLSSPFFEPNYRALFIEPFMSSSLFFVLFIQKNTPLRPLTFLHFLLSLSSTSTSYFSQLPHRVPIKRKLLILDKYKISGPDNT